MLVLRIIEETRRNEKEVFQQVIENFELGNSYAILKKGMTKEFSETMKSYPETKSDGIRSLLCAENDLKFFIMEESPNKVYSYFIMTESGKTFEKL